MNAAFLEGGDKKRPFDGDVYIGESKIQNVSNKGRHYGDKGIGFVESSMSRSPDWKYKMT